MDTERWHRVGDIFERVLGAPRAQRQNVLQSLCGGDAELEKLVVSMLDSQESRRRADASRSGPGDVAPPDPLAVTDTYETGARIGPWRLVSRIGTGGMGVVWLAERADGQFRQRAALKLIKRGMDSEAVLGRFLRERQILARLDHPNIAHLLDGGIAPDGRPYFAMEYVEGLPLLAYCAERGLKLEERLGLFLGICAAIRFAHERHIVHRDIKPTNILVTPNGGIKLLDFGIAKLLQPDPEDSGTLTRHEQPMTPAYAAPEQIGGGEITAATDVYALGGVFYELLTGRRPHDFARAADARQVLEIILATDPVAPGRLKLESAPVPPGRLRGDLDTIALTALKQMPARRYPSVAAFAADIENYLAGKPIAAKRDHAIYRSYKFMRRNRAAVAAALALAVIAALAFVVMMQERAARGFVGTNPALAIVDFTNLAREKQNDWISAALGEQLATELAIGGGVRTLPGELVRPAQADLPGASTGGYARGSLATLRKRLAADYVLSGSYYVGGATGASDLRLDLALQDALSGQLLAMVTQSGSLSDLPRLVENAATVLREKMGLARASALQLRQAARARPQTLDLTRLMGNAVEALGKSDPASARAALNDALALSPGYAPAYVYRAQANKLLGYDAKALADAEQAAAHSEGLPPEQRLRIDHQLAVQKGEWSRVLEFDKQLVALDPHSPEQQMSLIRDLLSAGQYDAAEKSLAALRKLPRSADDPRIETLAATIAQKREDYAGQLTHALAALKLAQDRDEQGLRADATLGLAQAQDQNANATEAEALVRRAIEGYQRIGNPQGEADSHSLLASMLMRQGRAQGALDEDQRALAIFQRIGNNKGVASVYSELSKILWNQGDHDASAAAARRAQEINREIGDAVARVRGLASFATFRMEEAANDDAMEDLRQAFELSESTNSHALQLDTLQRYAEGLRLRGELDRAQRLCDEGQAKAKQFRLPQSSLNIAYRCGAIAFDRGDIAMARGHYQLALAIAAEIGYIAMEGDIHSRIARVDMDANDWHAAREHLLASVAKYKIANSVGDELVTQSLLALCLSRLHDSAYAEALQRARALRPRVTERRLAFAADLALAQLADDPARAANDLLALADDAEQRFWLAYALEARLAALPLLRQGRDSRAEPLARQVEAVARQHGFRRVLARLDAAPKWAKRVSS